MTQAGITGLHGERFSTVVAGIRSHTARAVRRRRRAGALAIVQARVRTLSMRLAIIGGLLLLASIALGTITVNNIVIKRSVELGRLDDARRSFRTENALLAADIAKLSAPPRIVGRAKKRLGMVPATQTATFLYLDKSAKPNHKAEQNRRSKAQAKVADAIARGESVLRGDIFLRPVGVRPLPRALPETGATESAGSAAASGK